MTESSEVIIVGAGAVGAACASALPRAGRPVRLLAHRQRSTTAVSGGHLLLQSKAPGPAVELARRSLELLREFAHGREEELEYVQRGSLILAATEEEARLLQAHVLALRASGIALEWLDGPAVRELEPALGPSVVAASYCPMDAQIHPGRLARAWLADALARGAALEEDVLVDGFHLEGGCVAGVTAGGRTIPASAVVLAAGPWSEELAAAAGLHLQIRPRRGVLLRAAPATRLASRPLLGAEYLCSKFGDDPCSVAFSFQQSPAGEAMLGGSREFVGFSTDGLADIRQQIVANAARYLPALHDLDWSQVTVGFRPWSAAGPRVGPCEIPGLYLACGHEGDGITLAAATAEQIVACLD